MGRMHKRGMHEYRKISERSEREGYCLLQVNNVSYNECDGNEGGE